MDNPRILIIDDDPNLRKTLSDIIRFRGYEPIVAGNGAEGLASLQENPANVVLIDLGLPDISGVEVLRRVKSNFPSTEAIILTGNASLDSAIEAANRDAFSYLVKPYEIEQLMLQIRRALEKQQAENALRESEERFRKIFEEGPLGMALADLEKRFIKVNDMLCRVLGYTEQELALLMFMDIIHADDKETYLQNTLRLIKGEAPFYKMEQRFIRNDGGVLYGYLTISMICDMCGNPSYFLLMIEDLTAFKNLERQLRHAQKMKAIGTLTGGIAHAFNNILQSIAGFSHLLLMESQTNGPTRKMIGEINFAVDRATNLIRGMLTFSQQQLTNPQPVLLNETIRAIRTHLEEMTGEKVTVETELSEEGLIVMADMGQIEHILINLTENARDAMPSGGVLTIKTSAIKTGETCIKGLECSGSDLYALISVSDSGEGMDGNTVARIFEPFFTTREVGKGTGLGLSVVYGIVKHYGGYIDVLSEPGKGTTFNIYLPLSAEFNVSSNAAGNVPVQALQRPADDQAPTISGRYDKMPSIIEKN